MSRTSYKTALRAKGIKSLPPYHKLRSAKAGEPVICATTSAMQERPLSLMARVYVNALAHDRAKRRIAR